MNIEPHSLSSTTSLFDIQDSLFDIFSYQCFSAYATVKRDRKQEIMNIEPHSLSSTTSIFDIQDSLFDIFSYQCFSAYATVKRDRKQEIMNIEHRIMNIEV